MNYPKRGQRTATNKKKHLSKESAAHEMGNAMTKKVSKTHAMKEKKNKTAKYH